MYSLGDFLEEGAEQLGELIEFLGPNNIFLSLIIIGLFVLFSKVLVKLPLFQDDLGKPNMSAAGIVAIIISFSFAWLINRSGAMESVHAGDVFDYLGYSSGSAATIIPLIVLGFFIYMMIKIGPWFLILGGLALFGISFTDLIYSTMWGIILGLVLFLIGISWALKGKGEGIGGGSSLRVPNTLLTIFLILVVIGAILLIPFSSATGIIIFVAVCIGAIIVWIVMRKKSQGGNVPGTGKDWMNKIIPLIGIIALILFIILIFSRGSGGGSILLIIIAAVVGIILIVWIIKKSRGRGIGSKIKGAGKLVGSKYDWEKEKKQARWFKDKTKQGWNFGKEKFNKKRRDWAEKQAYKEKAEREKEEDLKHQNEWRENWEKSQSKERKKQEKRRKENYERAKKKEREEQEKKEKVMQIEYKKQEEKKQEQKERDRLLKIKRKLRREYTNIESKSNGKITTKRMREIIVEIKKINRKLKSL
ncbi:MAG: hypothetical protein PVJ67_00730 [Candidatus Pacearchaeota archaeon]|jgi:hypothetical protein